MALSSMTMHHLLPDEKQGLYEKLFTALRPEATYVEGDYVISNEKMKQFLTKYNYFPGNLTAGSHHIDIPLSKEKQLTLLKKAEFRMIEIIYTQGEITITTAKKT